MLSSKKISPYSEEIIINLLDKNYQSNAARLSRKYSSDIKIINMTQFIYLVKHREMKLVNPQLKGDSEKKRIYIVGHCLPSKDYLFGNNKEEKIYYAELAKFLGDYIGNSQNLTVNLVSCFAAKGSENYVYDSFAAKLHTALVQKTGRDIPVVARNSALSVLDNSTKETTLPEYLPDQIAKIERLRDEADYGSKERQLLNEQIDAMNIWRRSGSKVRFKLDEKNNQICVDDYLDQWRSKIFSALKETRLHTSSKAKKEFLQNWETKFKDLSDDEIGKTISLALDDPDSILRKHTNFISSLFGRQTFTYNKLKLLVEARKRAMESPHPTIDVTRERMDKKSDADSNSSHLIMR